MYLFGASRNHMWTYSRRLPYTRPHATHTAVLLPPPRTPASSELPCPLPPLKSPISSVPSQLWCPVCRVCPWPSWLQVLIRSVGLVKVAAHASKCSRPGRSRFPSWVHEFHLQKAAPFSGRAAIWRWKFGCWLLLPAVRSISYHATAMYLQKLSSIEFQGAAGYFT